MFKSQEKANGPYSFASFEAGYGHHMILGSNLQFSPHAWWKWMARISRRAECTKIQIQINQGGRLTWVTVWER
jgi:hypothetical protein